MSLVFSLFSILLVSVGSLVVIINNASPTKELSVTNIGFFVFVYLMIYSVIYLLYILLKNDQYSKYRFFNRRLLIFSFLITGIIVMSSLQVLNIISFVSFILSVALLELFFMSQSRI